MKELTYEQALARAAAMCSGAEHSTGEMEQKLRRWGVGEADVYRILDYLVDEKYIDNRRYARAYCLDKFRYNHWGRVKIQQMLRMQGVESDAISYGLSQIDEDEYLQMLDTTIAQKARTLTDEDAYARKAKIVRHLVSRGFEMGIIMRRLDFSED